MDVTRRDWLWLATAGVVTLESAYGSSGEFWNKKAPGDWTTDEKEKLTTKSPWAHEATGQLLPGTQRTGNGTGNGGGTQQPYPGGSGGGIGMPRIGGIGMPRRGGGGQNRMPRKGGGGGSAGSHKGTVRWESAQPILDAEKIPLSESFANRYVISVSGFSEPNGDNEIDELKLNTTLKPKDKEYAEPGVVEKRPGRTFWFGFSKEILDLSLDDKEVEFTTHIGRYLVKTKFILKDMQYRGKLSI